MTQNLDLAGMFNRRIHVKHSGGFLWPPVQEGELKIRGIVAGIPEDARQVALISHSNPCYSAHVRAVISDRAYQREIADIAATGNAYTLWIDLAELNATPAHRSCHSAYAGLIVSSQRGGGARRNPCCRETPAE